MRGIYYKPEYNDFLGEFVAPEPDAVAHALARNFGWTIVPCGDTALNLLGLSTQIPAAWVYVSDGTYKEYTYEQTTIKFKRTTNKEISKLSYKTALVVNKNKSAPARTRGENEYLLTTKLFCGHCKEMMVGYGGTGKSGKQYHYYMCKKARKKKCDKKINKVESGYMR